MNAKEIEVGFLEIVGNAMLVDEKKYHGDMDKLLKGLHSYFLDLYMVKLINLVIFIYLL